MLIILSYTIARYIGQFYYNIKTASLQVVHVLTKSVYRSKELVFFVCVYVSVNLYKLYR